VSHQNVTNLLCLSPGSLGIGRGTNVPQLLSISFDMGNLNLSLKIFPLPQYHAETYDPRSMGDSWGTFKWRDFAPQDVKLVSCFETSRFSLDVTFSLY